MQGTRVRALAAALAIAATAGSVQAEEFEERFTFSGSRLLLGNVVGSVTLERNDGTGFELVANVRGADATRDAVEFERNDGDAPSLVISFPGERRLSYPELKRRAQIRFSFDPERTKGESFIDGIFRRGRGQKLTVSGGRGFEGWVDVTVRVPSGGELVVRNGVGALEANDLNATLDLATRYGPSRLASLEGDIVIDTGNGDVDVRDVTGRVNVDTGNGDVDIVAVVGDHLVVDTGNGHVVLERITCERLEVDTGNGRIDATSLKSRSARLDTGNGQIDLAFDEIGDGRYVVDTGNGSIDLQLPPDASADVEADTGHGRIRLDLDESSVDVLRKRRDNVRFRMGEGTARIRLDSGNGSIRISV